jgi:hypothetical protein
VTHAAEPKAAADLGMSVTGVTFGDVIDADAVPSGPLRASKSLPRLTVNLAIPFCVFMEVVPLAAVDEAAMAPEQRARRAKAAAKRARKQRPR